MSQSVTYNIDQQVATIAISRPQVKNALDHETHLALYDAFEQADNDANVKVIVLTGTGDAFCAGADLKSIPIEQISEFDYGDYLRDTYNKLLLKMNTINKPIVANINGICVGAGLSIALACDYRVASYDAKFALSFLKIGLVPDAGASYYLPRLVGLSKALELALGDPIAAEEAYRIGLIHRIGKPEQLIEQLAAIPAEAFGYMKRNMIQGYENKLEDVLEMEEKAQRLAGQTPEHHAAIKRFVVKK